MDDKQIEEMAHIIAPCEDIKCSDCVCCNFYKYAEQIYNAGYRKQSDTAGEIVKRLKELLHKHEHRSQTDGVSFYQMNAESFCDEINELATEYGVEVEE